MAARKAKKAKVEEAPITPLKLPRGVKTLVVYGGSFDPPHSYHTHICYEVLGVCGDSCRVLYVPAARSPHKPSGPVASDHDRVAMILAGTRIAKSNEVDWLGGVWTDEVDRALWHRERGSTDVPSYSIESIRRLRRIIPKNVTLRLLIGSDQALAFHKWRDWRALIQEAEPMVLLRDPAPTPKDLINQLDSAVWSLRDKLDWATRIIPFNASRQSSTEIRRLLPFQPLAFTKWTYKIIVNREVKKYIIKHRLYGVGTKWKLSRVPPRSARGERAKPRKK